MLSQSREIYPATEKHLLLLLLVVTDVTPRILFCESDAFVIEFVQLVDGNVRTAVREVKERAVMQCKRTKHMITAVLGNRESFLDTRDRD
ncbi:unnamed protein product [Nippostrongylus brasiliensis]|uniref:PI3K/PI4K domain-containing protein n=1 Tax=Nippostrongylus brasiliensis TaxID=27835 RepID=A0A0N4XW99_NIPBR|nr:unnamed protein product [Nippostrongylus brasiliensis]